MFRKMTSVVLSHLKCKIIFPSTHVVFAKDTLIENIKEDYEKFPVLP